MSDPAMPRKADPPSLLWRIVRTTLLTFLVLFVLASLGSGIDQLLFLVVSHGVFGWMGFLLRVVPAIQWNPMAIATALVCVAFLLVGTHSFLAWLSRSWQAGQADAMLWRKSWTVSLVSLVFLAFVAGTAVVGVTHQIAWLRTSPDPWIRSGWNRPEVFSSKFAYQIKDLRAANKPLPAAVLQRMRSDAGEGMRVVVLSDKAGLPWFVAVGAYEPSKPGWKLCAYMGWTGTGEEERPVQGYFIGDQWAALIAEAEAGRPLDRFGR